MLTQEKIREVAGNMSNHGDFQLVKLQKHQEAEALCYDYYPGEH